MVKVETGSAALLFMQQTIAYLSHLDQPQSPFALHNGAIYTSAVTKLKAN